jgi:putative aldouronate transport system substrate-binding protein
LAIEAVLATPHASYPLSQRLWLEKLNMAAPTTLEECEAMLVAFKDNADLLLGADAIDDSLFNQL